MVANTLALKMETFRDSLGRVESSSWTVLKERRPVEKRTYDINGQVKFFNKFIF